MDDQRRDHLHEQASGYYLQGDLPAARRAWQQLLELDPGDERAQEGVRLCEQLEGGEQTSVCTAGQSPFATAPAPAPAPAPGDVADVDVDVDGLLDLSDLKDDTGDAPLGPGTNSWNWDAGPAGGAAPAPTPAPAPRAPGEDPATLELRRRVNELLASALVFMEQGRKQEAMKTLDRLLILDEDNEAAVALRRKIETEMATAAPDHPEQHDSGAMDGDDLPPLELAIDELRRTADRDAAPPADDGFDDGPFEDLRDGHDDADLDPDDDGEGSFDGSGPSAVPSMPAGAGNVLDRPRNSGRVWLYSTAALVLVVAAGYWGLEAMNRETVERTDPAEAAQAAVAAVLEPIEVPTHIRSQGSQVPEQAEPQQPEHSRHAILLMEADDAIERGDYGAAVVALDSALKLAPDRLDIRARLDEAAASYRASQAVETAWGEVHEAWAVGNYKSALRLLYRFPDPHDADKIRRHQADGWYNLGVTALQIGDCHGAETHFEEARQLFPEDKTIQAAVWLAGRCLDDATTSTYRQQITALKLRDLDV